MLFSVGDSAHAPAHDEVGLFKGVIVRIDFRARRILDQEQGLMDCAERAIDKHLDGHACSGVEAFHLRRAAWARKRRLIEVPEHKLGGLGAFRWSNRLNCKVAMAVYKKGIPAMFDRPRLRRLHLEPASGFAANVPPRMLFSGTDKPEVSWMELVALISEGEDGTSAQYIETLFKGVHVALYGSAWIEVTNSHTHMDGTNRIIHIGSAPKTSAVFLISLGRLGACISNIRNMVHLVHPRHVLCRCKLAQTPLPGLHKVTFLIRIMTRCLAEKTSAAKASRAVCCSANL